MALLRDITDQLAAQSVADVGGSATGWELFESILPETTLPVITVYDAGGGEPDNTAGTKYETVSFQVRGRGRSVEVSGTAYGDLRAKMQDVFDALNDATITGYVHITAATSSPIPLGYDKINRPGLVWNFTAMVERTRL